jgi:hypothetical protein
MPVELYFGMKDNLRDYLSRLISGHAKPMLEVTGLDRDPVRHHPVVEDMLRQIREQSAIKQRQPRVTPGLAGLLGRREEER